MMESAMGATGKGSRAPRKPKFSLQKPFASNMAESKAAERRQAGPEPFTPQINARSQQLAAARRGKGRVEDRFERLDKERKEKIEAQRRKKLESELSGMSPPKMTKKSRAMTKNLGSVEDRLMEYQKQARMNLDKARQETLEREEDTLTFHPKITKTAQQLERGPAVWEQWYKDKYKRLKDLERAVRCQDLQDMREPQISKGTAKLAAKRPDADKKVYERLYAYQDKYRENRENLVREEEERFSGTGTGTARPPSTQYERTRRAAERRRARAYEDDDGGYTETPSQLFSTVNAESHERQPFTPAVNDHSTQIVRQKQERALQMAQGPDSHRSYGSTPRVYGTEVAPRVVDKKHQRSKEEWNSMVNSFKRDFDS